MIIAYIIGAMLIAIGLIVLYLSFIGTTTGLQTSGNTLRPYVNYIRTLQATNEIVCGSKKGEK
jgi:hypothetical protein